MTEAQKAFFKNCLGRFTRLLPEIDGEKFWRREAHERFGRIKDVFSLYAEIFKVPVVKAVDAEYARGKKPPQQIACRKLLLVLRHLFAHFPHFECWNDIYFCREMVTWDTAGANGAIEKFFRDPPFESVTKFRIWHGELKKFTYFSVSIPTDYTSNRTIFLKEIMSEKEGVQFSIHMMADVIFAATRKAGFSLAGGDL